MIYEGLIDDNLLRLLEMRVKSMLPEHRYVTLLFDEIHLKELLDYDHSRDQILGVKKDHCGNYVYPTMALTLMIMGVRSKWKQGLSFYFVKSAAPADRIFAILLQTLDKLQEIGLHVLCMTSDQGGNFYSTMARIVTPDRPFILHKGQKIHILADPPHLIKSARNALLDHQIVTLEGRTTWRHIRMVCAYDRDQISRMAPKLTQQHLAPPPIYSRMRVSKAAQVLSHTVSCTLHVQIDVLPAEALATTNYTERMNKIFDLLNSHQRLDKTPFKSALSPENVASLNFMEEAITWLQAIRIKDRPSGSNSFEV